MLIVGIPAQAPVVRPFDILTNRRSITGSSIGGIKETQEMLDYCAEKNIVSDVELIPIQEINAAYDRMTKNDVRYRFVIDLKSLG
jgi:alcohol dehydrogenase (NADP+)